MGAGGDGGASTFLQRETFSAKPESLSLRALPIEAANQRQGIEAEGGRNERASRHLRQHILLLYPLCPAHTPTMATTLRPTLLRQALAASNKRAFTTTTTTRPSRALPIFTLQRAAFQTSSRRQILPALPQKIEGSVNDAAPIPDSEPTHGSYHWTTERYIIPYHST